MSLAENLFEVVEDAYPKLTNLDGSDVSKKEGSKWSKKEILGHLIDSSINNHRRFLVAQSQLNLIFDGYVQDEWVLISNYHQWVWQDIVESWHLRNLDIAKVISRIPEDKLKQSTFDHNFDQIAFKIVPKGSVSNLEYFITDYIAHLEHHLSQILPDYDKKIGPY